MKMKIKERVKKARWSTIFLILGWCCNGLYIGSMFMNMSWRSMLWLAMCAIVFFIASIVQTYREKKAKSKEKINA